jgi:PTH2 family peptidyl-tRNA hydrolase
MHARDEDVINYTPFPISVSGEVKMVIIVRTDLKMSKGKLVSQACHAAIETYEMARRKNPALCSRWRQQGGKKVVLKVSSLTELEQLKIAAERVGLPCAMIVDKGLTELPPNTPTALGIGPAPSAKLDQITGHLKLL